MDNLQISPSQSNENFKVLALIPAFNEAAHVSSVVVKTKAFLPVLVLDDGSTDDTASQATMAGATVLRQDTNRGKGAVLRAGLSWAIENGYDAVLTLDADGQHDPAEIPKFLSAYRQGRADLIIGCRRFSEMPLIRRFSNWLGRWSFSWVLGQPIPDNQSGYRLISQRLIEALLASHEQGFEFEVEMITICIQRGYALDWVPIRTIYAGEQSHIHPLRHTVNFVRLLWQTHHRLKN